MLGRYPEILENLDDHGLALDNDVAANLNSRRYRYAPSLDAGHSTAYL